MVGKTRLKRKRKDRNYKINRSQKGGKFGDIPFLKGLPNKLLEDVYNDSGRTYGEYDDPEEIYIHLLNSFKNEKSKFLTDKFAAMLDPSSDNFQYSEIKVTYGSGPGTFLRRIDQMYENWTTRLPDKVVDEAIKSDDMYDDNKLMSLYLTKIRDDKTFRQLSDSPDLAPPQVQKLLNDMDGRILSKLKQLESPPSSPVTSPRGGGSKRKRRKSCKTKRKPRNTKRNTKRRPRKVNKTIKRTKRK
jgi:hypothetical protein